MNVLSRCAPAGRAAIALTAVGALLAGCAHGSATRTTSGDGRKIVHYMTFSAAPDHLQDLEELERSFERTHPDIDVRVQTAPFDQYFTQLQTSIAGGTAPDVMELNQESFAAFADSGALADLAPRMTDGFPRDAFTESSLTAFTLDGTQYALPSGFSTELLFYNKDLFDRAGLDYPTESWTWEDERRAAQRIAALGDGVYGDFQNPSFLEFVKALAQAGGSFLSADGTRPAFNSPQGVRAATWLTEKVGTTMPTASEMGGGVDYDTRLFTDGRLGMWHSGSWFFPTLAESGVNWDVTLEPHAGARANSVFQNAHALSSQSANADEAWKWLEYLTTSEEVVNKRIDSSWELSPATDDASAERYTSQRPPENRAAVFDALDDVAPFPQLVRQAEIADVITNTLEEIVTEGTSVAKALDRAAEEVAPLLE